MTKLHMAISASKQERPDAHEKTERRPVNSLYSYTQRVHAHTCAAVTEQPLLSYSTVNFVALV
jgi:hypothetical protein